jgi:ribulose-phosphate 3-epimerase
MVEIIPAIMPDNYKDLKEKANRIRGVVPCAQIDVMDGKFVPSVSWPYDKDGVKEFTSMVSKGDMLPFWDEIDYEIDLMIKNPEEIINDWITIGARRIIIHIESTDKTRDIIEFIKNRFYENEDFVCFEHIEFGIALGTETSFDKLSPFVYDIDVVQLMGIKKIGYQGQEFDENTINRVKNLRERYPHLIISIDGGVGFKTAPKLISVGVSRLVSGSAIFGSLNVNESILKLKQL